MNKKLNILQLNCSVLGVVYCAVGSIWDEGFVIYIYLDGFLELM